ncbi:MAG: aminotransferase class I/II-fold pyridoxal phosphate-dependent enzyme [Candidatus Diapherotrites archaeon]|nr:aminotransferase class I/II-fold pyridoxal phosphate-dependent enzyme [Candidatus Diapherotrites archaeon]
MPLNREAIALNETIKKNSPAVFSLLSGRGKAIFFPKRGILSQGAEAKGKKINATIGIALEDNAETMRLPSLQKLLLVPHEAFSYAPSFGRQDVREKWRAMLFEKNPSLAGKETSLPVATIALTHGLSMAAYLFADAGDKIILPSLFWENYRLVFENAYGARLDTCLAFRQNAFNVAGLEKKLSEGKKGKKILLLNFPNNPSGYTPTVEEAKKIVEAIKKSGEAGNKILALLDDAYFGLVFEEGIEKESLFSWLADLHENILAVKIDGPTKEDFAWGFRVGFVTFGIKGGSRELYAALEAKLAGAIRGSVSNAPNISQVLLLQAQASEEYASERKQKFEILRKRYGTVKDVLAGKKFAKYFVPLPFNSGYFMCIKLNDGIDAEKVRQVLLKKYDTGVIVFGNLVRIAFSAVPNEKIPELFENIFLACAEVAE